MRSAAIGLLRHIIARGYLYLCLCLTLHLYLYLYMFLVYVEKNKRGTLPASSFVTEPKCTRPVAASTSRSAVPASVSGKTVAEESNTGSLRSRSHRR